MLSKKNNENINKIIAEIYNDCDELRKETNLSLKIKKHTEIKNRINITEQNLYKIRDSFNNNEQQNESNDNKEIITDEKYEKNIRIINKLNNNENNNDNLLEEQIELYKKMLKLINECELYLKSKKMEIIKCED